MRELELHYDMVGFDEQAAAKALKRVTLPAWHRYAWPLFLAFIIGLVAVNAVARLYWRPIPSEVFVPLLFSGYVLVIHSGSMVRRRLRRSKDEARRRHGTTSLTTNAEGITFDSQGIHATIRWHAMLDVIPGPDGLLLRTWEFDFIPLPACAFPDKAAEAEALQFLNERIAAAKGQP